MKSEGLFQIKFRNRASEWLERDFSPFSNALFNLKT